MPPPVVAPAATLGAMPWPRRHAHREPGAAGDAGVWRIRRDKKRLAEIEARLAAMQGLESRAE